MVIFLDEHRNRGREGSVVLETVDFLSPVGRFNINCRCYEDRSIVSQNDFQTFVVIETCFRAFGQLEALLWRKIV